MDLFLDTNVLLGYTFKTDRLHKPSTPVIENELCKYSGTKVREEYERKYKEIINIKIKDMTHLIKKLCNKQVADSKEIMAILNKHISRPKIEALHDAGLSTRDIRSLINDLRDMLRTCQYESQNNKNELMQCIAFIDRGTHLYTSVSKTLYDIGLVDSNSADSKVILDAHHVGLTKSEDLYFVTDDSVDIISRTEGIVNCTSIKDIIPLVKFSNYCKRNN